MLTLTEKNQSENQFNFFTFIPFDVLIVIFKCLSPKELAILSIVSKDFNHLSNSNYVWFDFFQQYMASLRIAPEFNTEKNYKNIYRNPFTEVMEKLPCSKQLKGNEITHTYAFFEPSHMVRNNTSNIFLVTAFKENESITMLIQYKKDSHLYVLKLLFENNVFKVNSLSQEEINEYEKKLNPDNSITFDYPYCNQTKESFLNKLFKKIGNPLKDVSSRDFMKNILINEFTPDSEKKLLDDFFDKVEPSSSRYFSGCSIM